MSLLFLPSFPRICKRTPNGDFVRGDNGAKPGAIRLQDIVVLFELIVCWGHDRGGEVC